MGIPYSATDTTLSVVIDFSPKIIPASHPNFEKIKELLFRADTTEAQIRELIDVKAAVETFKSENIKILNGKLYYKGFNITGALSDQILGFVNRGQLDAAEPYKNFLERAQVNPDPRAVKDLYEWVAASNLPITSDGCILAWKAVQADYKSIHSGPRGKLDHSIGKTVSEPREETDSNPDVTCSRGLHFCSAPYLKTYTAGGTRIVAVKIDPANVVAFPKDYQNQKGRACEYTVVGEVTDREKIEQFYPQGRAVYRGFDKVEVKPQEDGLPKTGQVWQRRNGAEMTIKDHGVKHVTYPVRDHNGTAYTKTGRYLSDAEDSPFDLVKKIS